MNADILVSGAIDGILSGLICGGIISIFERFFVTGWLELEYLARSVFPLPVAPIGMDPFLEVWLVLSGVSLGLALGLIFSLFNRSIQDHVRIRSGLKYGAVLSLSYLYYVAKGMPLIDLLDPLHAVAFYAILLAFPVFLFGSLLVLIWNWNWGT